MPGASGTQRFPRLVGLKAALDMIPTGKRIGAQEAAKLGIVDKVGGCFDDVAVLNVMIML